MKKFLVLYSMPYAGMQEWMGKPEEERKAAEAQMKTEWDAWTASHKDAIIETAGAGKTTVVTKEGVTDSHNDLMLYSLVQGESKEVVTELFKNHPHLSIPEAKIEIMEANVLPGMQA
jgi:enamine deaminase RidA (YjgF/YER057c/UK114 family)